MPNVGPLELAIVLIIALIVFGPKRLPELGRSLGKGIREFRGSLSGEHNDEPEQGRDEIAPPQPPEPAGDGDDTVADDGETVVHDRN
jgi:sec-independent protein translocase protein TatA